MITLYTIGCPQCLVLENKLDKAGLTYTKIEDIEQIQVAGYNAVPVLVVDNEVMDFVTANKWLNGVIKNGN